MRNVLAVLAMAVATLLPYQAAAACSCLEMTPERSAAVIENAALIFEGSVTALELPFEPEENMDYEGRAPVPENLFYAKARLKIADLYKGAHDGSRVSAYIDVVTSCGHEYQVGDFDTFILSRVDGVLAQNDTCSEVLPEDWRALKEGKYRK